MVLQRLLEEWEGQEIQWSLVRLRRIAILWLFDNGVSYSSALGAQVIPL